MNLAAVVSRIARTATREGAFDDVYLVGGSLRDALIGRPITDLDVVAGGDAAAFAEAVAQVLGTRVVHLGEPFHLYRVPSPAGVIDITPMRGDLDADLRARDFTVNAMALPLAVAGARGLAAIDRGAVIDPLGGLADLERGQVRLAGPGALHADPVRALRAVRLAAELSFAITDDTLAAMADPSLRAGIGAVAAERHGAEIQRLCGTDRAAWGMRRLEDAGLLTVYFSVLEDGRETEQRPVHRYRVLEHQLVALEMLDILLAPEPPPGETGILWRRTWEGGQCWTAVWGDTRAHLREHAVALRLATLLHDAGKPATRTVEADGRTRFFGHAELGARMARDTLRDLRLPGALVDRVALLVDQHLRPGQIAPPGEAPSAGALHRFHRGLGDAVPDLCFLFLADSLATAGVDHLLPRWPAYVAHVHRIITWERPPEAAALRRLVDGHAVMQATGLPPSPGLGRIMQVLDEATATGEVSTEQEALSLARRLAEAAE